MPKENLSVVLIDDNEFDLFLFEKFLEIKGVSNSIKKFEYAADALKYLEDTDTAWPDLIFLDIHMPMMNGFDFLESYKSFSEERRRQTKILMVSSTLDHWDNERALKNPLVLALLTKPLNMDELIPLLRSHRILE